MNNIEQILAFLEQRQIDYENFGEPEEIAFQLAISDLTPNQCQIWHEYNNQQRINKLNDDN